MRKALVASIAMLLPLAAVSFGAQKTGSSSDLEARSRDDSQWVMPAKNWQNTRYSSLSQVNAGNAGQLRVAWMFSLGTDRGQEEVPLVVDNTMYIEESYPNKVYALNATTGEMEWVYSPRVDPSAVGEACCDQVTRGEAYDNGKIFVNTLDDHTVALDAKTGKELWVTKDGDINTGETITMAPFVAHGKVFVGNSGGELGVRGWITALDENTGRVVWRAYNTGPDKDVLIGKNFHPYYPDAKGTDLGVKTWPPGAWKIGGGNVWGWISYDPELNLLFYGSGNPGPWNSNQRPGDNLWTTAIFARDPDTGDAKWADVLNPHDLWDYDEINESMVLDLKINGQNRKVLVHPGRDGYMFVIDRATGQILSADPYDTVTATTGFDLKTGRPIHQTALSPVLGQSSDGVCPASPGAKDWQPTAYSPRTGFLYIPHQHLCMNYETTHVGYIAGTPYVGAVVDMYAGPGGYRGEFAAWDPVKRKKVWAIHEQFPVWSGTLVTGGDVAFYGTLDRWFKAVNARDGKPLYQFQAPSGFIGQPMTYMGSDGTQYVAIVSGAGGWAAALVHADIDPRIRNGALGFTGATQDLVNYTAGGSDVIVFSLNGKAAGKPQIQPIDNPPIQSQPPPPGREPPHGVQHQ